MLSFFFNLFRKPKNRSLDLEKIVKNLVIYYSRGNVNLQIGNYITPKKANELKQNVLNYKIR